MPYKWYWTKETFFKALPIKKASTPGDWTSKHITMILRRGEVVRIEKNILARNLPNDLHCIMGLHKSESFYFSASSFVSNHV